ncbi:MAG: pyridoxamine 5'-phosphate oxidase family protein [Oscillospiraceae bacterium]|nr:pyridoxamine 5'-phosphate oxidase family protein [Oscillospiraceae bacterium]
MFRELQRKKQQLSHEECLRILQSEPRGVLCVLGDDGYPYGIPMDFWYCAQDGKIYFHSGKTGHKIDALRRCGKVSFCVCDSGFRRQGEWALNISSVVVFGKVDFIPEGERALEICRLLSLKYTDDEDYIAREIRRSGPATLCFSLTPEHITGKLVNES